jgi:hypothetical protein
MQLPQIDFDYNCPPALKEALHTRFKNGDRARLASSIKIGMRAAIQEIKHGGRGDDSSNLEWDPLKDADPEEREALQAIFKYLEAKGMKWTRDCLVEESAQAITDSQFDLVKLATMQLDGGPTTPGEAADGGGETGDHADSPEGGGETGDLTGPAKPGGETTKPAPPDSGEEEEEEEEHHSDAPATPAE